MFLKTKLAKIEEWLAKIFRESPPPPLKIKSLSVVYMINHSLQCHILVFPTEIYNDQVPPPQLSNYRMKKKKKKKRRVLLRERENNENIIRML